MRNTEPSEEAIALGARITAARTEKDMSVARLAELAGVSKAYMHQIENGDCARPSAQVLFNVAQVLNTSVGYLLGRTAKGPEPGTIEIPDALREFAATQPDLDQEHMEMLARIRHRGKQPQKVEDWQLLWLSIKKTVG